MKSVVAILLLAMMMQGCALGLVKSVHQVSLLEQVQVPSGMKSHPVQKDSSQNVVLGLVFDVDFANKGWKALQNSCPNGTVLNPMVRYSTELGFFAYRQHLLFSGTCVEGKDIQ